jgi:LAS superfamily LD-carboxypeptidase LdcB
MIAAALWAFWSLGFLISPNPAAPILPADWSIDYLTGHFEPAGHADFIVLEKGYASAGGMYLRRDALAAFKKMHAAAKKQGVNLLIISATRNFDKQKSIWEAKWSGERILSSGENAAIAYPNPEQRALKIMEYSAMPGASRHHWGTDIDLNNLSDQWFLKGPGKVIYAWLSAHASEYGFCQPYSPKGPNRPEGYKEEKWHWSYVPIASQLMETARKQLTNEQLKGFSGAETAVQIGVVKKYVLGVNTTCQ